MQHISEGTVHLLFLLVLLLPAPLLVSCKRYRMHVDIKYGAEVKNPSYKFLPLEHEPDLMLIKSWGKFGGGKIQPHSHFTCRYSLYSRAFHYVTGGCYRLDTCAGLPVCKVIRVCGTAFAGVASVAWVIERLSQQSNFITSFIVQITGYAPYLILLLSYLTLLAYLWNWNKSRREHLTSFSGWPPLMQYLKSCST